jgi:hypothetical protein
MRILPKIKKLGREPGGPSLALGLTSMASRPSWPWAEPKTTLTYGLDSSMGTTGQPKVIMKL